MNIAVKLKNEVKPVVSITIEDLPLESVPNLSCTILKEAVRSVERCNSERGISYKLCYGAEKGGER